MRIEKDSLGSVEVPKDKYWGAQTARSLTYFSIGDDLLPTEMIHAMGILKKASALANHELGFLPQEKMDLIVQAADEVISGKLDAHFPLYVWMTGSGTHFNMNVNEVISNRAIELTRGVLGSKTPIHPNDHVNMSQSSNDTFPTAMCMATFIALTQKLIPSVTAMSKMLWKKSEAWNEIIKIGRTHMQDAVPMTLGQEFSGYATLLDDNIERIQKVFLDLSKLAIGGTAIGTGLNAPEGFASLVTQKINELTGLSFTSAPNKFAVQGSHDAFIAISGALKGLACSLNKIAKDLILLSCGPRAGLSELFIPPNEPGSSIMPGKVNPTQCESMLMVTTQVIGYDVATSLAGAGGYLEMNVYKPIIIFNVLKSIRMLSDSCHNFTKYLLEGLEPNVKRMAYYVENSLMLVTALSPIIGYDAASKLALYANEHDCSLKEANQHLNYLSDEEFDRIVDPKKMTC